MAAACTFIVASQNVGMGSGQRIATSAAQSLADEDADVFCMQEGRPLHKGEFEDNASLVALIANCTLLDDGPYLTSVRNPALGALSLELPLYGPDDITKPGAAEKYKSRTFQQVTVYIGGYTIVILNMHCRCGNAMNTAPEFRRIALHNVKAHAEQMLHEGKAHAALVVGDANLTDTETMAAFSDCNWMVEHINGGIRNNGQRYCDVLAFVTHTPAIHAERVASSLSHGANQLSDVHGVGKLRLTITLPRVLWTRYLTMEGGNTYWWGKGEPQSEVVEDFFLEESAAAHGWTLTQREGVQLWSNGVEHFYVTSGFPFLL